MCQLCAVYSTEPEVATAMLFAGMYVAGAKNGDGCGIYGNSIWKSELGASKIINLLSILRSSLNYKILGEHPAFAHVRLATANVGTAVKSVSQENSHPFEGSRFVLMHNGVLYPRFALTKEFPAPAGMTDSEYFLTQLERIAGTDKSFEEAFTETMKEFTGKFAFLIADKQTGERYAIRGNTATLNWVPFYADVEKKTLLGWAVLTDKADLQQLLILGTNLAYGYFDVRKIHFEYTDIQELKRETIFRLDPAGPVEVGTATENFHTGATTVVQAGRTTTTGTTAQTAFSTGQKDSPFIKFCAEYNLRLTEVVAMICTFYGISSPMEMSEEQVNTLSHGSFIRALRTRTSPKSAAVWKRLLRMATQHELYTKHKVEFPYIFEDLNTLLRLEKELEKEMVAKGENKNAEKQ